MENVKRRVIDFLKQPLIYVVIVCIICQIKIYSTVEETMVTLDSTTYTGYAENTSILHGQVDEKRTPVYPYFIKLVQKLFGEENIANKVTRAQEFMFIITVILFYACVSSITKNKLIITLLTLIFGTSPFIILWNVTVLTEAMSIMEVLILTLLTIKYLKKPRSILAGSIGILILIMIMTRPSYIYLLPIYLLFWALRFFYNKEERKKVIVGIISCVVCSVAILGYCGLMKKQYDEFVITKVSNLNNIVSVIKSGAYKKASNEEMIKVVDASLAEGKTMWDAYYVLADKYNKPELEEFANSAIKTPEHFKYLIKKTVELGTVNIGMNYIDNLARYDESVSNAISYKDVGSTMFPVTFGFVYYMMAFSVVYLIIKLIKTKQINWIVAFFASLILANIFTLIVGAPEEEQRLFASSVPLVMLFIAYIVEKILKRRKEFEK